MTQEAKQRKRLTARRIILTSFLVDVSDIVLSFIIAVLSGSIVMVTQVLEGISDLSSSGLLLIGLKRSMQKEDKTHPFGYGREIYFWTLMAAVVMFGITATVSFYLGWQRFNEPEVVRNINLAILVLLITLVTNAYSFVLSLRRLLRNRSFKNIIRIFYKSSLVETKTTFILDLMGTTASFFGFIALGIYFLTGDSRFDGLGAMVIGVSLAVFSIFLILGIKDMLVGRSASVETEEKIKEAALKVVEVERIEDIKTLHIGPEKLLVSLEVHMERTLKTKELESLIDKIEQNVRQVVPSAKYVLVELES